MATVVKAPRLTAAEEAAKHQEQLALEQVQAAKNYANGSWCSFFWDDEGWPPAAIRLGKFVIVTLVPLLVVSLVDGRLSDYFTILMLLIFTTVGLWTIIEAVRLAWLIGKHAVKEKQNAHKYFLSLVAPPPPKEIVQKAEAELAFSNPEEVSGKKPEAIDNEEVKEADGADHRLAMMQRMQTRSMATQAKEQPEAYPEENATAEEEDDQAMITRSMARANAAAALEEAAEEDARTNASAALEEAAKAAAEEDDQAAAAEATPPPGPTTRSRARKSTPKV